MFGHVEAGPGVEAGIVLGLGRHIPAPDQVAVGGTARIEVRRLIQVVAADADDHAILHDDRRDRAVIHHLDRAVFLEPVFAPGLEVEGNQIAIRRHEEQRVAEDADPAVADLVAAAVPRPDVVPQLAPRSRLDGIHVIGRREIQDAVHLERCRLHAGAAGRQVVQPRHAQVLDVRAVDLRERAVAASRVVAVVGRPRGRGRLLDLCARQPGPRRGIRAGLELRLLGDRGRGEQQDERGRKQSSHFRVSR